VRERKSVFFFLCTQKIGGNFADNFWTIDLKLFIIIIIIIIASATLDCKLFTYLITHTHKVLVAQSLKEED
jgi:hypothetical protein